jgi:hypothetical protein
MQRRKKISTKHGAREDDALAAALRAFGGDRVRVLAPAALARHARALPLDANLSASERELVWYGCGGIGVGQCGICGWEKVWVSVGERKRDGRDENEHRSERTEINESREQRADRAK